MPKNKYPKGHWQKKENVLASARKYTYQAKWAKAEGGAFGSAKRNGWLEEACQHMTSPKKPMGHWTLENLIADAKNYSTPSSWRKNSASAYATAIAKGYLEECCVHMERLQKQAGYWTKEKCIESAKKYRTIKDWSLGDGAAYDFTKRNGWIKEATKHMIQTFSHGELTIYTFLLQHNIQFEYQKRFKQLKHIKRLPFDFFLPEYNLVVEYQGRQHFETSKTSMYRKNLKAQQERDARKKTYALEFGLKYLDIDAEKSEEIEKSLTEKLEAIAREKGGCLRLVKRNLTDDELKTLTTLGTWTKEEVLADAKKYQTVSNWKSSGNAACQIAYKRGWIKEATKHMVSPHKPKGYWIKERVLQDAQKYTTKMEWFRGNQSAYAIANTNGWLTDATAHMNKPKPISSKPKGYWSRERVFEDAKRYKTKMEWFRASRQAYRKAQSQGWLTEITNLMDGPKSSD